MYISLYDLALFIAWILLLIISGYLIAVLRQTLGLLTQIRETFTIHKTDIHNSLSLLPEVLVNMNDLNTSLRKTADQTSGALHSLQAGMTDGIDSFQERMETAILYANLIIRALRAIFSKAI